MKISLVHAGALGDTILLAPLLRSLKQRWPQVERTLVSRKSFGELLLKLRLIEHFADSDDPIHSAWFGDSRIPNNLMPTWAACDLLISAVSDGADNWAWHAQTISSAMNILYFSPKPPEYFIGHVTEFHRRQLAELKLPEPDLPPPAGKADGPLIIHPGSGGRAKCFPLENFILIAQQLRQRGIPAQFVLGEVELQRWDRSVISRLENEFPVTLNPSLPALADLLIQSRGYLGNDSGPSHLAAALGLPAVVIFITGSPQKFRPIGPGVLILEPPETADVDQMTNRMTRHIDNKGYPDISVP